MYQELLVALAVMVFYYSTITESRAERKRWRALRQRQAAPPRRSSGRYFDRHGPPREVNLYETNFGAGGPLRSDEEIAAEVRDNHEDGYGSVLLELKKPFNKN